MDEMVVSAYSGDDTTEGVVISVVMGVNIVWAGNVFTTASTVDGPKGAAIEHLYELITIPDHLVVFVDDVL